MPRRATRSCAVLCRAVLPCALPASLSPARRTLKLDAALGAGLWRDAADDVFEVLADLVVGFQTEEVEAAQQVVVQREELQVQLGQRKAVLARVKLGVDDVGVPQRFLMLPASEGSQGGRLSARRGFHQPRVRSHNDHAPRRGTRTGR